MSKVAYHPIYLRGIEEFNRRNFFESHEIWEDLWNLEQGEAHRFYQGLIQAAVALHHLRRGNAHGATKLLARSQRCLAGYRSHYLGLDVDAFLSDLARCVAEGATRFEIGPQTESLPPSVPIIQLDPPPAS